MAKKDPRIDAYIAKSAPFAQPILKHIRKAVHAGCPDVEETLKWGFPHFLHQGILCGMAAFKAHCTFGFWKGSLIPGKDKGLKTGTSFNHFGHLGSLKDLPNEKTLIGYVKAAVKLNEAGVKSPTRGKPVKDRPLNVPAYFAAAVKKNKKAAVTFEVFSLSKRREYVEWVTEAKTEETRAKRLKTSVEWLSEGKVLNWKYVKK